MNIIEVGSFLEYIEHIENNCSRSHIFRGVNRIDYRLIPKIGREEYDSCEIEPDNILTFLQDKEEQIMRKFIKMSVPYMDLRDMSAWEQWTIGQHHGLPTRFLDWTENPLIAAYFATEKSGDNDVAVYVVDRSQFNTNTEDDLDVFSLFEHDDVVLYEPSYIHPRIIAQKGVFTVHKNPTIPLDEIRINEQQCIVDKIIISKGIIKDFVNTLDWFGINRSFIYPGLDGLAYHLDYSVREGE